MFKLLTEIIEKNKIDFWRNNEIKNSPTFSHYKDLLE